MRLWHANAQTHEMKTRTARANDDTACAAPLTAPSASRGAAMLSCGGACVVRRQRRDTAVHGKCAAPSLAQHASPETTHTTKQTGYLFSKSKHVRAMIIADENTFCCVTTRSAIAPSSARIVSCARSSSFECDVRSLMWQLSGQARPGMARHVGHVQRRSRDARSGTRTHTQNHAHAPCRARRRTRPWAAAAPRERSRGAPCGSRAEAQSGAARAGSP